ncbi:PARP12 [Symbiodinium natans]|uniref:Poly [ADP-ribose] polymerase n=1 Tax=Symbiodinium natans TaxID=878477 RepID=A0A812UM20_9DINO|nr:PARP12 [Symbiodinium natans]
MAHGYAKAEVGRGSVISSPVPAVGAAAEVFSSTSNQWEQCKVIRVEDNIATVAYQRGRDHVQKALPLGHPQLRLGSAMPAPAPAALPAMSLRPVCREGAKCKARQDPRHLEAWSHPFDPDYRRSCEREGLQPFLPTLHLLFGWVDADGSGKISRSELEQALPLLERLQGERLMLTEESWEQLDEDGNGAVNFSEFAQWAGPRLGLPLGVDHLFADQLPPCGIIGCPCPGFRLDERAALFEMFGEKKKKKDKKAKKEKKHKRDWEECMCREVDVGPQRIQERLDSCACGHKKMVHRLGASREMRSVPLPQHWVQPPAEMSASKGAPIIPLPPDHCQLLQRLLDSTYSNVWTRDRKRHHPDNPNVPRGFRVVRAYRAQNFKNWQEYAVRRAELLKDAKDRAIQHYDVQSSAEWASYTHACGIEPLQRACNEWVLFHGTAPPAALEICRSDFRISLAGDKTGTLYGRGTYFAESITKADEYAKAADGEYAMLLVRALGGRVRYCDEVEPDAEDLTRSCIEGPYDCVLGDRKKCRGTYREFVFFDTENLFPEYIVIYSRQY